MKFRIKTVPLKQWDIGREFRKRLKKALEDNGVKIPVAQRIVAVREGASNSPPATTGSPRV